MVLVKLLTFLSCFLISGGTTASLAGWSRGLMKLTCGKCSALVKGRTVEDHDHPPVLISHAQAAAALEDCEGTDRIGQHLELTCLTVS